MWYETLGRRDCGAEMTSNLAQPGYSPVVLARIAGVLALVGIACGAFDMGYVRNVVLAAGDAGKTLANLESHESLFRLGFGAHLLLLLCNVAGEIIFFLIFRRVNLILAGIIMAAGLVGTAIESLDLLLAYVPLSVLADSATLSSLSPDQMKSLTYQALQLENYGFLISFVFYGIDELLGGILVFRSGFIPRVIAVLYGISGVCYLSQGFISFLSPALEAHIFPYILFPCPVGEGLISLWLAIMGINDVKWQAWVARPDLGLPAPLAR
jgi:hypothetical protein